MGLKLIYDTSVRVTGTSSDTDADEITQLHKMIPELGGQSSYSVASSTHKLYYAPNVICTGHKRLIVDNDSITDCVGASGDPSNINEEAGVAAHFLDGSGDIDSEDHLMWIVIKNTGYAGPDKTVTSQYLTFNQNGNANQSNVPNPLIYPGEIYTFQNISTVNTHHSDLVIDDVRCKPTSGSDPLMVSVLALIHDASA